MIYVIPKQITGDPVFFVRNKNKNLVTGWRFSELRSRNPIKMDKADILAMYGVTDEVDHTNPPDFLEIYKLNKQNKAACHDSLPGLSETSKIMVAIQDRCWYWIPNREQIVTIYRCRNLPGKCLYNTEVHSHYTDHVKTCTDQSVVKSKRTTFGPASNALDMAIDAGLLPSEFKDYRQKFLASWDIETLEVETDLTSIQQAVHKVVSIAVASNLPNQTDKFFVRDSSKPEDGQKLVDDFLDEVFRLEACYNKIIPSEIKQAKEALKEVEDQVFSKERTQKQKLKNFFNNYFTLPVYGFNSGKFDTKVIIGAIYDYCGKREVAVDTIKRSGKYFSLRLTRYDGRRRCIEFRDILNFSSPTTLDRYIRMWGGTINKSIFPYGAYRSVEELRAAVDFPTEDQFFSKLRQQTVDPDEYKKAKEEFQRRKKLPNGHPEQMKSMECWLKYYNLLDVKPLVQAIDQSFSSFWEYFKVDGNQHHSLPSMAFNSLFKNYPADLPFVQTFNETNDHLRQWFRENLIGGLTSVYHRHLDLSDDNQSPRSARFTPDGSRLTHAEVLDFSSMYLWAEDQPMPLGPGLLWTKKGKHFHKKVMVDGCSLGQLEWLNFIEIEDEVKLEHAYHRGETTQFGEKFRPDGYALIDGIHTFYEYLGCRYHPGCCIPDSEIENADQKRKQWEEKSAFFKANGVLRVMRECTWQKFKKSQLDLPKDTPLTNVLQIDDEETLLKGIADDSLFGFLCVDVSTPPKLIEEFENAGFLFPPVIRRLQITEELLSPYMRQRFLEEEKTPSETVVQTYTGKQVFALSTMVNRWLKMGLKVSNVTKFVQYQPGRALAPFVKRVTEGRIAATYEKDEAKANTYKLFGNGSYGKCGEDKTRHTTTKVVFDDEKLNKLMVKPFFKDEQELVDEEGEVKGWEVESRKKTVFDDKPVHVSAAILQHSKVLFLDFMLFLYSHLKPGSFLNSYADTDSICLGLSRTKPIPENATLEEYYRCLFDPLVRPEMLESWEAKWKSWICTTEAVEDQRKPGKLKREFGLSKGHFIALSPKCYFVWNEETKATKRSSKGVPHSCPIQLEHYLKKLYGKEQHYSTLRSLRMVNKEMSRTEQQRSSLSDLFCKFKVQDDAITCKPLSVHNFYL